MKYIKLILTSICFFSILLISCNASKSTKIIESQIDTLPKTKFYTIDKAMDLIGNEDKYKELKSNYILDEYTGMVSSTILFENGTKSTSSTETFVIRNEVDYSKFIKRIYKYELSKKHALVENNDKLRKKPDIDFSKHMLIVLIRNDNPFANMQLRNIKIETDPIIATVTKKELNDAATFSAYPLNMGSYNSYLSKLYRLLNRFGAILIISF